MKVAIVGYGIEGSVSARHWQQLGATITICDQNKNLQKSEQVYTYRLGDNYLENLDGFDLIVRSPSVHPRQILETNPDAPELTDKITTSLNEFFARCPSQNIICVTGTKGKGTTSTLIANILEADGKSVHLGGNIGIAPLEILPRVHKGDWVVLELSNFQLIDMKYSPRIGVCLMVAPEHLDWHADLDEYVTAKQNLFRRQGQNDLVVYNLRSELSKKTIEPSKAQKIGYDVPPKNEPPIGKTGAYVEGDSIYFAKTKVCGITDVALLGQHNLENVCAATGAVWDIIKSNTAIIKEVVSSFSGLPHRIEFVREVNGVRYYNDSFASNPNATIAAIKAMPGRKLVVIGGYDRMLDLNELVQEISDHAKDLTVLLIGASAKRTARALEQAGINNYTVSEAKTMNEIVGDIVNKCRSGDSVLFSPGFPSFDMFKNFEDRGLQFKEAVYNL